MCQAPEKSIMQDGSWGLGRYVKIKEVQRIELRRAETLLSSSDRSYSKGQEGFLVLGVIMSRLRMILEYFSFILNCGLLHFCHAPIPVPLVLA